MFKQRENRLADKILQKKKSFQSIRMNQFYVLFIILISVFIIMSFLSPNIFFSLNTAKSIGFQVPEFGIYSLAMMLAMISGGIDLSIVSIGNLSGIIVAQIMVNYMAKGNVNENNGFIVVIVILAALLTGLICGFINGFSISVIGIQPILTTLATMQIFTGISMVITKGASIQGFPRAFGFIGDHALYGIIPIVSIVFIAVALVVWIIQSKTRFGLELYMVGTNKTAAKFSGINCTKVIICTYVLSGILASVAGLILTSRSMSAKVDYGSIYLLQSILAVVLGGTSTQGGYGKVVGVVMSVIILQILSTGMNILRLSTTTFIKNLVWGILLLLVLIINYFINKRNNYSINK